MRKLIVIIGLMIMLAWGTDVSNAYEIRIGLQTRINSVEFGSQSRAIVWNGSKSTPIVKINGMQKYSAYANSGKIFLKKGSSPESFDTEQSSITILPVETGSLVYNKKRWYRGELKLVAKGNKITIINVVDIEDYLKGVVPSEMPASWNIEALKAQAIAARSYALANLNKRSSEGYDLVDTTLDQVYKGASGETSRSTYAVETTKSQVIVQGQKIIPAYYHSCSGGMTDNEAWSGKIDFVKAVRDFDSEAPQSTWNKNYSLSNFSNALASAGVAIGVLQAVIPVEKTEGGRIKQVKLVGSSGTKIVSGDKLENLFKLTSKFFDIIISGNSVCIAGRGNGHGIGLSQWGAKALAERGCNVYQILGYYFANVSIKTITES